jgi:hypothetical protein
MRRRKAWAECRLVGTDERVHTRQVEVIVDDHERTGRPRGHETAGRVGENEPPDTGSDERADREHDAIGGVTFVQVGSASQEHHPHAAEVAGVRYTCVSLHTNLGPVR